MKKQEPKSKRFPSDFDFCPKHKVFFKSCGCKNKRSKKVEENKEEEENESDS